MLWCAFPEDHVSDGQWVLSGVYASSRRRDLPKLAAMAGGNTWVPIVKVEGKQFNHASIAYHRQAHKRAARHFVNDWSAVLTGQPILGVHPV